MPAPKGFQKVLHWWSWWSERNYRFSHVFFCALTANLSSEDQVGTQWGQFLIDAHCIFVKCKQSMQWIGDAVFLPLKTEDDVMLFYSIVLSKEEEGK